MKRLTARGLIPLLLLVALALTPSTSDPQSGSAPAGRSATLLSDGQWLLLGGEGARGPLATAAFWDPRTQTTTPLPAQLNYPRAWHSATALPDGGVLIVGGVGGDGRLVRHSEIFHPDLQTFERLSGMSPSPRAGHTTSLLTDGFVLIAGGVGIAGQPIADAELWDPESWHLVATATLVTPRSRHLATLSADGTVLLAGGLDSSGLPINTEEFFDPTTGNFLGVSSPAASPSPGSVALAASLPPDGAVDVPTHVRIALRFSDALRPETLTPGTVLLSGPDGPHELAVVVAEVGRLAFVTPSSALRAGAPYTLSIVGTTDHTGFLLPPTTIAFTTAASGAVIDGDAPPRLPGSDDVTASVDDEAWIPQSRGEWRAGRPASPWQSLPPLEAPAGVTALAGQVLRLHGRPLEGATLRVDNRATRTDATGRFLLVGVPSGRHELIIDGRTASQAGRTYGVFEVGVDIAAEQTNVLPYTIWMPVLDTAHAVQVPAYTTSEVVVTTPRIPGLELRIPAHSSIRDHEGRVVTEITITPIPVDRPPFPLPERVYVPIYFTVQPGGGYVYNRHGDRARLVYPNYVDERPGTRANFWHYDPEQRGWYIYGLGSVTPDGRQVMPDPGIGIYEFTGAMINVPGYAPPPNGPTVGGFSVDGDPVDLSTGLFVLTKTDLMVSDVMPLALIRTYRPGDTSTRPFGAGATHSYELFLWSAQQYQEADLILPDGGRVHYVRTSPGTGFADAVFEHTVTPSVYYKSEIRWNGSGWDLRLKDGTVYVFGDTAPLNAIRDRNGNRITISRASLNQFGSPTGNITRVTSPNGRWIEFAYDASNRITQATDNIGRAVSYAYDASGRLTSVTDPVGGVTQYTYDTSHRLLTLRDPRAILFLANEYDVNGRVSRQTQADGTIYQFVYALDGSGRVTQTDVTNPRGYLRRVTFNTSGYALTDTRALGTATQQTMTYQRDATSNFLASTTDSLNRTTVYVYDAMGNVASVTRLSGTPNTVTTTFTCELVFNQVTSVTDPLNHTTTFAHDAMGNVTTITNPLGHQTNLTYNSGGQPITITTPAGTSSLTYEQGNLVSVMDAVGGVTSRYVDNVGRLNTLTSQLGHATRYDYDGLDRLTRITDALGGVTQGAYDANGNLLTVTDARGSITAYGYNNMDRLTTRTDPLLRPESYTYDNNGNPTNFSDRKTQTTSATYDALDRLTLHAYADGSTTTYVWDAGNRLTQLIDSLSGTITLTYDGLDRLTQEATAQGTVSYAYDAAGRRVSMTVAGQPAVTYGYNNADRLVSITQAGSVVSFTYDAAARRTSLTLPNGTITDVAYDPASRITGLTYRNGTGTLGTLTYAYDVAGNRRQVGGTWARTGLPQAVGAATYDTANRQLTFGSGLLTYDFNGNVTGDGSNIYTWNPRDQLIGIGGGVTGSFNYDALGRRMRKTIDAVTTEFVYDRVNTVQELSGGSVANLIVGLGIDEYFGRSDTTGARTIHTDVLGSVLALTDNGAAIQTEYTYDPFGGSSVSGTADNNSLQYTGRENDGTGLYYYRARYYHPRLHRFIGEDPIGFAGGDVNLYAYVGNRPTAATDPLGLWKPEAHRELTREVAEECGLSAKRNATLAEDANTRMDKHPSTLSPSSPAHAMPNSPWRQYVATKLSQAVAQDAAGDQAGAMNSLGQGLHAVQDAWAHDLRRPQGTMMEHAFGKKNPDIPGDNPKEWKRAREATRDYIKDFMRARGLKAKCK